MKKSITFLIFLFFALVSFADDQFEVGAAAGPSYPLAGSDFKSVAKKGNNQNYWIGYGLEDNMGVELGVDIFDFDQVDIHHQAIQLSGVYHFAGPSSLQPFIKIGAGTVYSNLGGASLNAFGGKMVAGFECELKNISIGGMVNYYFISKAGDADSLKNIQVVAPAIFITLHDIFRDEKPIR